MKRRVVVILIGVLFAAALLVTPTTAAGEPQWNFIGPISPGCTGGGFIVELDWVNALGTVHGWDTMAVQNGLVYMDEYFYADYGDGLGWWGCGTICCSSDSIPSNHR